MAISFAFLHSFHEVACANDALLSSFPWRSNHAYGLGYTTLNTMTIKYISVHWNTELGM